LTLHDSVRIPDEVATRKVGEGTVLLDLNTGIYFGLDAVGSRFVELLRETSGEIAAAHRVMLQEFDVTPEVLETDLLCLAEEMCAKRLLVVETN
jgi:hypothetical protein